MTPTTNISSSITNKQSYKDIKCEQLAINYLNKIFIVKWSTILHTYKKIIKLTKRMNISKPSRTKLRQIDWHTQYLPCAAVLQYLCFSIITHLQSSCIIHAIHEIRLILRNTKKNRRNGVNKQNTDTENITLEKVSKNK